MRIDTQYIYHYYTTGCQRLIRILSIIQPSYRLAIYITINSMLSSLN